MTWAVEVVRAADGFVVKTLTYRSERQAERGESGAIRNLNVEDYFTRIVELPSTARGEHE